MKLTSTLAILVISPVLLQAQEPLIRVPAGTHIQLELINRLSTRASHVGDAVRAQIAFPVSVGDQVVIPAGTFLEGQLQRIQPKSNQAKFFMNFDRVTFANGYSVSGGDGKASAKLRMPRPTAIPEGGFGFQTSLPPLPSPPTGFTVAKWAIIGAAVVTTVVTIIAVSKARNAIEYILDPGTRFEMVLDNDLQLDPAHLKVDQ